MGSLIPLLCAILPASPDPQNAIQKALYRDLVPRAMKASAAASKELLSIFATASFKESLKNASVPQNIISLTPEELLKRFEDEVLVSEQVHNFCATSEPDGAWGER